MSPGTSFRKLSLRLLCKSNRAEVALTRTRPQGKTRAKLRQPKCYLGGWDSWRAGWLPSATRLDVLRSLVRRLVEGRSPLD